jgi:hypothetical protein
MAVLAVINDACGVSGNGLCKLALLELCSLENEGICDIALSSKLMLELVWKLELAVDQLPEDSPEVRPGSSLDT